MKYFKKSPNTDPRTLVDRLESITSCVPVVDGGEYIMYVFTPHWSSHEQVKIRDGAVFGCGDKDSLASIDNCVVAFLRVDCDDCIEDSRPVAEILTQAIANLSAVTALARNGESPPFKALLMHFMQGKWASLELATSEKDTASDGESFAREWLLWEAYFALADVARTLKINVPDGKLYSHVRVDDLATDERPRAIDLKETIERWTLADGWFNYVPATLPLVEHFIVEYAAKRLRRRFEIRYYPRAQLSAHSTLVRVFREDQHVADYIVIQDDLPAIAKTFLALYEFYHSLCDVGPEVPNVTRGTGDLFCFPPGSIDAEADRKAEFFAMAGILPTTTIAWTFFDELQSDDGFSRLLAAPAANRLLLTVVQYHVESTA